MKQKDEERVVKDEELEQQRRKKFTDRNTVEEVIESDGDQVNNEEMLKSKMKKEKDKIFVKNAMQKTTFEMRKMRRERKEGLLKKLESVQLSTKF